MSMLLRHLPTFIIVNLRITVVNIALLIVFENINCEYVLEPSPFLTNEHNLYFVQKNQEVLCKKKSEKVYTHIFTF